MFTLWEVVVDAPIFFLPLQVMLVEELGGILHFPWWIPEEQHRYWIPWWSEQTKIKSNLWLKYFSVASCPHVLFYCCLCWLMMQFSALSVNIGEFVFVFISFEFFNERPSCLFNVSWEARRCEIHNYCWNMGLFFSLVEWILVFCKNGWRTEGYHKKSNDWIV